MCEVAGAQRPKRANSLAWTLEPVLISRGGVTYFEVLGLAPVA